MCLLSSINHWKTKIEFNLEHGNAFHTHTILWFLIHLLLKLWFKDLQLTKIANPQLICLTQYSIFKWSIKNYKIYFYWNCIWLVKKSQFDKWLFFFKRCFMHVSLFLFQAFMMKKQSKRYNFSILPSLIVLNYK